MIKETRIPVFQARLRIGNPAMPFTHYHAGYELYYPEAGNRQYLVEDKFFVVSAGDVRFYFYA